MFKPTMELHHLSIFPNMSEEAVGQKDVACGYMSYERPKMENCIYNCATKFHVSNFQRTMTFLCRRCAKLPTLSLTGHCSLHDRYNGTQIYIDPSDP